MSARAMPLRGLSAGLLGAAAVALVCCGDGATSAGGTTRSGEGQAAAQGAGAASPAGGAAPATAHAPPPPLVPAGNDDPEYAPRPAGSVTWAEHVAPIVLENCAPCHRPGEAGPFPLLAYDDARRRARQIAKATGDGYMPPWLPQAGCGDFADERRLSREEIGLLRQWHVDGAPQGDPAATPPVPDFPQGWQLGEPDLVVELPEAYTLPAEGEDVFRQFVVPLPIEGTRYVRGFEFRPDNAPVVHHARLMIDPTGRSRLREEADPEPGFEGAVLGTVTDPDGFWLGWTPGKQPYLHPPGRAWKLQEGSDLVIELHLLPSGKPERIRPRVGLHFSDEIPERRPLTLRIGPTFLDIPAGASEHVARDAYRLPVDVEVLSVYAHAHLLGRTMEGWAELPDGTRRWLLRIADWDFDWQDEYRYREPVRLPAGTVLHMRYAYDNSAANPENPNAPPERVLYGMDTGNEMSDLWFLVLTEDAAARRALAEHFSAQELLKVIHGDEQALRFAEGEDAHAAHLSLGSGYQRLGRFDVAERHFREARALDPEDALAVSSLAGLAAERGDFPAAATLYREALKLAPRDADAHMRLGHALLQMGDRAAGMAEYQRALELHPRFSSAYNNLGVALQQEGRLGDAEAAFRSALRYAPELADAHANLAVLLQARGALEQAETHLRQAARFAPRSWAAHMNLGNVLQQRGALEESVDEYLQALDYGGRHPALYENLAQALQALGRADEARAALEEAGRLRRGAHAPAGRR